MSEQRQPGYYWVRKDGNPAIAKHTIRGTWIIMGVNWDFKESDFDEIGSRITPEMKYTEEDMIEFAKYANDFVSKEALEFWLKQKDKDE